MRKGFLVLVAVLASSFCGAYGQISLRYHLQLQDRFELNLHSQQDSYLTLDAGPQRTTQQMDARMLFTVDSLRDGSAVLRVHYESLNLQTSQDQQNISVNTAVPGTDQYSRLFGALIGQDFFMTLQPNGTIRSVRGTGAVFNRMIAAVPGLKAADKATLKHFLESQFGPAALKTSLAFVLPRYPDHRVQTGDSWMDIEYTKGLYSGRIDNYWKLDYGDKFTLRLSNKGKFSTDASQQVDFGGKKKGYVNLQGTVEGHCLLDPETDWPAMVISHSEMQGNYVYEAERRKKRELKVPVRVVMDASYQFKHL